MEKTFCLLLSNTDKFLRGRIVIRKMSQLSNLISLMHRKIAMAQSSAKNGNF